MMGDLGTSLPTQILCLLGAAREESYPTSSKGNFRDQPVGNFPWGTCSAYHIAL